MILRSGREAVGGVVEWRGRRYTVYSIYVATSPCGAVYVGCTIQDLKVRWDNHKVKARGGSNAPLHRAMREHGAETFVVRAVAQSQRFDDAQQLELDVMDQLERDGARLLNRTRWSLGRRPVAELPWPAPEALS